MIYVFCYFFERNRWRVFKTEAKNLLELVEQLRKVERQYGVFGFLLSRSFKEFYTARRMTIDDLLKYKIEFTVRFGSVKIYSRIKHMQISIRPSYIKIVTHKRYSEAVIRGEDCEEILMSISLNNYNFSVENEEAYIKLFNDLDLLSS